MTCDLAVLGAGPGGYDAALEAAALGLKVALIERDVLGGTCLNRGCIPTKLLLGASNVAEDLAAQTRIRQASGEVRLDLAAITARTGKILEATRKAMGQRLAAAGVEVIAGQGRIKAPGLLEVTGADGTREIACKKLILATGARPGFFPGLEPDHQAVLDSTDFLRLTAMPESLIVVGAGFIGLEMAQAAHRFGARITVVDALDRVAAQEDPEVSAALAAQFRRWKWDLRLSVRVASVTTRDGQAVLRLDSGEEFTADKALVAVGRRPNSEGLNLEALGIQLSRQGFVQTDERLLAAPDVWAVGDLNGRIQLAHAASHQARYAGRAAAGQETGPYAPGPVPSVLYGNPETIRVGRMPAELKQVGLPAQTSQAPLAANPIAQAHGQSLGFVKAVWSEGRLAGVTAVGYDVSRLVTSAALMVRLGWRREDAEGFIFAHPTLDEALHAALLAEPGDA